MIDLMKIWLFYSLFNKNNFLCVIINILYNIHMNVYVRTFAAFYFSILDQRNVEYSYLSIFEFNHIGNGDE